MNPNETIINNFYDALSNSDIEKMKACYHQNIHFTDPVFGMLRGNDASDMWNMILDKSKGRFKIELVSVKANEHRGSAHWKATYNFGKKNKRIQNDIISRFYFRDGFILKHKDNFHFWQWSVQAFGIYGMLLGWTPIFKRGVQKRSKIKLNKYIEKKYS